MAYNLAGAVAIPGDTDLDALQRAFEKLAVRHAMLRTLFAEQQGEPIQRVFESLEVAFQREDASGWSTGRLNDRLGREVYRPFDLEHGPTWRVVVFQRAPISGEMSTAGLSRDHLVLLTLHHIIGDLWSIAIIMSEVAALYREEATGSPASLKPLRACYEDHVRKELARITGAEAEASGEYWRRTLSGELSRLSLYSDRPHPPVPTGRGDVQPIHLDRDLTGRLRAIADECHVALYTVLLGAFQILLHRYTGQNDLLVGFTKAGRDAGMARVIGYLVNQMVVRADFAGNPSFVDHLLKLRKYLEDSARHDWYPFSMLVQRFRTTSDLGQSPLIQAVFSWQQAPRLIPGENAGSFALGETDGLANLGGLSIRSIHLPCRVAPFDLTVLASEVPGGLVVQIEYATELFDAETITLLAESYCTLLKSIAVDPEQPVSALEILPESEREKLLAWNESSAPYPARACLHQLFEQQVEQTPEAMAVADKHDQLSYRQLSQRANQLAHFLLEHGVGPDRLVGVCLEPSTQMVVAMLGILKAGGAYLPLDPNLPDNRLALMLSDAQPTLQITSRDLVQRLAGVDDRTVCLDADEDLLRGQPQTNPASPVIPDNLAYVMYTSGSTGTPKGVAVAHRGVVNLLSDFHRRRAISPGDACSWWTSCGFDVSVYEIFSALLAGGSLQVIPEELRLNSPVLLDWLCAQHIRSAYLPPFLVADFAAWVEDHPTASEMQRLLVGVEPIPEALLVRLVNRVPGLCVINGYGPTETTICSTLYEIDAGRLHQGNTPIGKRVANTQIFLLDGSLQPVPLGVVGEIFIGGVGLARGYLKQPEMTSMRFIESPFQPGERLYRTGDLARYLRDGNLMFVGRSDTQVKLHGMRIELGEIESVLTQHHLVNQAVVLLHEQASGGKNLMAFVVPSQGTHPTPGELRHFLSQRLPHTMVPSLIVIMDAFPLTSTGKVDRKAFRIPQTLQPQQANAFRMLQTGTGQILVTIWQQVLGVENVSPDDNFFELGGDSIMSLQVVARAAEAGLHLSPQDVFQAPTIAELAALADAAVPNRRQWEEDSLDDVIPSTPIQRWFFEQNFPDPHHWNQSLMFVTPQPLDPIYLRAAVADLLRQHVALRLSYTVGPHGWQATAAAHNEDVPFEIIDLSHLSGPQQADALDKNVVARQSSLNLSTGPLIRVVYFILGADLPGRLLFVIHHLAVDGFSWRILLEDLQSAYRQHERGQPLQLPHTTTSFQAWARRLEDLAQSPRMMEETSLWLDTFGAELPGLPGDLLPRGRSPDDLNTEATARNVSVSLSREDTQALLRGASATYGTEINVVLLTALARAFQRWTGKGTLWIDLEGHGREDISGSVDLTRTVGWFTALYPVRLDLPREAEPGEAMETVRDQIDRIPHHGLGYGLLRYLCSDPALSDRLRGIPSPSVSFNYLGKLPEVRAEDIISILAPEAIDHQRCPDARRPHLIEINAAIYQGELHVDWSYSCHVHSRHAIEKIASLFIDELRALVRYRSQEAIGDTPSEFPGTILSPGELDEVLKVAAKPMASMLERAPEAVYPLSSMQQGMVFHTLYTPESGVYFEQITFTVQGPFDVPAFERAWQRVLERHRILRTSFVWQGLNRMLQVVHEDIQVPLEQQDWRPMPAAEQQTHLEEVLTRERTRGFDLSVPPLLRLLIVRTADDAYQIVLSYHHALLDGWSVSLLFREVFDFYKAFSQDLELTLPPERPYRDYIDWLQNRDLAAAKAFWSKYLDGFAPASWGHAQPSDLPPSGADQPAELERLLSYQETAALQALARQEHLTISTFLQGAWAILLSRHFQRSEVLFGLTVAGRPPNLAGIETMVGLFINTLPLRLHLDTQSGLLEWLRYIQEKAVEVGQYGYSPLAKVQAWSGIPRSSPLFDTILVVENYPAGIPIHEDYGSLRIGGVRSIEQSNYPITVAVTPGKQLDLRILYDPPRFETGDIQDVLNSLCRVLESMVADPNQHLSSLLPVTQFEGEQAFGNRPRTTGEFLAGIYPLSEQRAARVAERAVTTLDEEPPPRNTSLEEYLVQLWKELLKVDRVGTNDNFFELGGDSLTGAICIQRIQGHLQETIPLSAIFEASTVLELARYLNQKYPVGVARLLGTPQPVSPAVEQAVYRTSLVPIRPNGNRPPLFCLHPAGGVVYPYYTLVPYLNRDQPLYGIQDPSLYDTQSAPKSIEAMATDYLDMLKSVQPNGPYFLLGWSVGGVVAYEMAQQLSRRGESVGLLIMLDTSAPSSSRNLQPDRSLRARLQGSLTSFRSIARRLQRVGQGVFPIASYIRSGLFLLMTSAKRDGIHPSKYPRVADLLGWAALDSWRSGLLEEAEVANVVSQDASLLLVQMPSVRRILELVREHRRLARRYEAAPYRGRIALFRASPAKPNEKGRGDPTLGWGRLADGGIDVRIIQANHVALLVKPYVEILAREISVCLDKSSGPDHP